MHSRREVGLAIVVSQKVAETSWNLIAFDHEIGTSDGGS
jgi:hypothetical protein